MNHIDITQEINHIDITHNKDKTFFLKMSTIQNLYEPWAGHSFEEIQIFVKDQIEQLEEILNDEEE